MTIKIRDGHIYAENGKWLKKIDCPKSARLEDMQVVSDETFKCSLCDHVIHDTDFMSKNDIVALLRTDPEACLKISILNPIFEVQT